MSFSYRAGSWARSVAFDQPDRTAPCRGQLPFTNVVGFIFHQRSRHHTLERVTSFYEQNGTSGQYIKEYKTLESNRLRLSDGKFRDNAVRLQLHAVAAYNVANFIRTPALPK